ncbi:MAG: ATP synthase F1 subunit epsilon [Treponema sp.]|nr:ATP synthase F1 subunit epsilon [Treponema sp.]
MATLFNFEIHTLYRLFFSGKVEFITLTLTDGEIGVYANHSFFTAPVLSCILQIKDDKGFLRSAFITGGILEVKEHKTVLMVDAAEWPEEIDLNRALIAKEKAEKEINKAMHRFEIESAKARLRRAEFRLKAHELKT